MKKFYAKLLLLGEYTIIKGSAALAVPYQRYNGEWVFSKNQTQSNKILQDWLFFLKTQDLDFEVNLSAFEADIAQGLSFRSNIPQGYGVGSSGALTAAFFSQYVTDFHNEKIDIFSLKKYFFQLEHFFHGGGSGIDPLICYLNQPIVFQADNSIQLPKLNLAQNPPSSAVCFLINTHIERKTQPLVQLFLERCKNENYNIKCTDELAVYTNQAIKALQSGERAAFFEQIHCISDFQLAHFLPMIPTDFQEIWKKGVAYQDFSLKLCGAGGGGFILGFTQNWEKTKRQLKNYDVELAFYL